MEKPPVNIVWLKRDLRLSDHEPLAFAEEADIPCIIFYLFEPSLLKDDHYDIRHWRFVWESLNEMKKRLEPFGSSLWIGQGEILPFFKDIEERYEVRNLLSHQETGLDITFERDKKVLEFCEGNAWVWKEFNQDGVTRRLSHRKDWVSNWQKEMLAPFKDFECGSLGALETPSWFQENFGEWKIAAEVKERNNAFQPGGESFAKRYLASFYEKRGRSYFQQISKPAKARYSCSRISPYLAWGNISLRQLYRFELKYAGTGINKPNRKRFISRVMWRSHFMQKFETDYEMEFLPVNRGFQEMQKDGDPALLEKWEKGETGFPMIDASMRALRETGYLNFRMRAMLVTFASFALWQDWREIAKVLARLFLDFEPGIHYGQIQMQSGLAGYHTLRIYNPHLQVEKHDAEGLFLKEFLPELKDVPPGLIARPWQLSPMEQTFYNCKLGKDYPYPIVDFEKETQKRKDEYWRFRKSETVQAGIPGIFKRLVVPVSEKAKEYGLNTSPREHET